MLSKKVLIDDILAFFQVLSKLPLSEKCIWKYRKIIDIKKCVLKTRKRVFHIPDEYEIVPENSALSCAALLAELLGL